MAEQTFKSPGFFEKEVDLSIRQQSPSGIPACVVGSAKSGPAFVPVTIGSINDFENNFGQLDPKNFSPYAINEYLKHKDSITFIRVLGAGANKEGTDFNTTKNSGTVKNAGFIIKGAVATTQGAPITKHAGTVQFIVGQHTLNAQEASGFPVFTDNDSFGAGTTNIIRGMVLLATGTRLEVIPHYTGSYVTQQALDNTPDAAYISSDPATDNGKEAGYFNLVISSSAGVGFSKLVEKIGTNTHTHNGIKLIKASLDPESELYIGNVLNTDPSKFQTEQHLLYGEFPVEKGLATNTFSSTQHTVAIVSGTNSYRDLFGRFDTRYANAKTTSFISQPFGKSEYDLFHFETLNDGATANNFIKVSIANLKIPNDPTEQHPTFDVQIRDFNDSDTNTMIFEQFNNCDLNPISDRYIAKQIGDQKLFYNFDASTEDERRLTRSGKYPNKSNFVRVVMNDAVENRLVPPSAMPFGFRGLPSLHTNSSLNDDSPSDRLAGVLTSSNETYFPIATAGSQANMNLTSSIVPPVPLTFKATKGETNSSPGFAGHPAGSETADSRIYWGIKTIEIPRKSQITNAALNSNAGSSVSKLVSEYAKVLGIQGLGMLTTGSHADEFNNNKFTLARVAFFNNSAGDAGIESDMTGSAEEHIREAAYIRNGVLFKTGSRLDDGARGHRISLPSLANHVNSTSKKPDPKFFNRFSNFAKFTNIFYGGFDGVNILDKDINLFNDKGTSSESGGKATGDTNGHLGLHSDSSPGAGNDNNLIASFRAAIKIATDPLDSTMNLLAIPGIRDANITDYAAERVKEYGKALFVMDLENYDDTGTRIFDGSSTQPSVRSTSENFDSRAVDNNYVATYFPDITIRDDLTNKLVKVPASVAAFGAIAFSDSVSYPWFAPAGFNRGALSSVVNSAVKLNASDRDTLYESRINPITNFPGSGFVIFGQKTLQFAKSSLDRVNVRRMLLEVKRLVTDIANGLLFEQNNQATRNRFLSQVVPLLSTIQSQQGIDSFKVIMDDSNNSSEDVEQNRLNGRIVLVPTRAVEFIAIDFIVTNSGVSFE